MELNDVGEDVFLKNKLKHALTLREANERLMKQSSVNDSALHKCYQSLSLSSRLVQHFEEKSWLIKSEGSPSINNVKRFDDCSAQLIVKLPLILNDQNRLKKNDNKHNLFAYLEITYNNDIAQSELVEFDPTISQIINFTLRLFNVDPQTKLKLSVYFWSMKTYDQKKNSLQKKIASCNLTPEDDFELCASYECPLVGFSKRVCKELNVFNSDCPLSSFIHNSRLFSVLLEIYPSKYQKLLLRNKVVVITVKEVLNMDEEGDEFSFLTLYWIIEEGNLKFYFDIYLSHCLEKLTTPLNEIENIEINEIENELIVTSTTLIFTLLIENTKTLHLTMEIINKVIDMSRIWAGSLINFPRSSLLFLKSALANSTSFFDTIGTSVLGNSLNF